MKKGIKGFIIILISMVFPWTYAQQVQVEISRDTIKIGDQLDFSIQVPADTTTRIQFPRNELFQPFEVVKQFPVDTLIQEKILRATYRLTAWDSGQYKIPSLPVKINDSIFTTDSIPIYVAGVKVDTTKQGLYPAKPAWKVHYKTKVKVGKKQNKFLWWLLGLLMLGGIIYWLFRRKQISEKSQIVSPYEKAMARWNELVQSKIYSTDWEQFYVKLTDLLDDYLEEALHIPAKESVSPELIKLLSRYRFENNKPIPERFFNDLNEFFKRADLAKFARTEPLPVFREKDLQLVKSFITDIQEELDRIEEQKRLEEEARQKIIREKQKKKNLMLWIGGLLILLLLGLWAYRQYKPQIKRIYSNQMSMLNGIPPETAWKPVELGSQPALVFTAPDVPEAVTTYYPSDSLASMLDEYAFLKSDMKNLKIYIWLFDLKKQADKKILLDEIKSGLENETGQTVHIREDKNQDIIYGETGENEELKGKIFLSGNKARIILLRYPGNNKNIKEKAEKILLTTALKN